MRMNGGNGNGNFGIVYILQGNPLECDCRMRWLVHWLAAQQHNDAVEQQLANSECASSEVLSQRQTEQKWPPARPGAQKRTLNLLEWTRRLEEEMEEERTAGRGGVEEAECRPIWQQRNGEEAARRRRLVGAIDGWLLTLEMLMLAIGTIVFRPMP